ncbi:MAG: ABC transporter substrate-binding protein [Isosphaeraceae bacterium]|nr:ABC transporter substrate-binding protein [Isosphaeraceae bacterium]
MKRIASRIRGGAPISSHPRSYVDLCANVHWRFTGGFIIMSGPSRSLLLLAVCSMCAAAGCDSVSFVPPPRDIDRPSARPPYRGSSTAAKEIVLILPAEKNSDLSVWEAIARQEAGLSRIGFRTLELDPKDPPAKQAELIEKTAPTTSGLFVVTNRSPETTAALARLSAKKTPIVLLGRALPESADSAKVDATLVVSAPYDASAKELVAAVVTDARKRIDLAKGTLQAAIIRSAMVDETSAERASALLAAAKAAGVEVVADETFSGAPDDFTKILDRIKRNHPKLAVLLCVEEGALSGLTSYKQESVEKPGAETEGLVLQPLVGDEFRVVGYISTKANNNLVGLGQVSALGDRNVRDLPREAVRAMTAKLEGKPVPPKIEIPIRVLRGSVDPGVPGKL